METKMELVKEQKLPGFDPVEYVCQVDGENGLTIIEELNRKPHGKYLETLEEWVTENGKSGCGYRIIITQTVPRWAKERTVIEASAEPPEVEK